MIWHFVTFFGSHKMRDVALLFSWKDFQPSGLKYIGYKSPNLSHIQSQIMDLYQNYAQRFVVEFDSILVRIG